MREHQYGQVVERDKVRSTVGAEKFGRIIDASMVEATTIAILKRWMPTYIAEMERQKARPVGDIGPPRSYVTINRFSRPMLENQLPSLVIVSPGLSDDPVAEGRGAYRAKWALGIAAIVSSKDQESTNRNCKLYTAAVRAVILQNTSLGGFASGVSWLEERYNDLPPEETRTLAVGQVLFEVEVANVVNRWEGPESPSDPPTADPGLWPEITETETTINLS